MSAVCPDDLTAAAEYAPFAGEMAAAEYAAFAGAMDAAEYAA